MTSQTQRLNVVDCLRGFAIVSIMLLHNIEHFDLYYTVPGLPAWLSALDKVIWDTAFFLFGGKSYAIFALLFGLTFFIQFNSRAQRGEDFRPRFAWRMLLLLCFGLVNTMFYHGDVLSFYAVLGICLIPVARLSNRAVCAIAMLLMLQPVEWGRLLAALPHGADKLGDPASWAYFGRANEYLMHGSATQVWWGNLTNGKTGALMWSWEAGRIFQIMALFMFGMLAGRKRVFIDTPASTQFWRRVLVIAALCFVPLYISKTWLVGMIAGDTVRRALETIVSSWSNLSVMLVLVSSFVLLFSTERWARLLRVFAPLGRMSLTSYVVQSIVGSTIYYGYGLGMYQRTGVTVCLLIGIVLATLQGLASAWWLRHHAQGPLEALWHRATWWGQRAPAPSSAAGSSPV